MKSELEKIITDLVNEKFNKIYKVDVFRPETKFGDFSTNIALKLAKELNASSLDIANQLADDLRSQFSEIFQEINVAKPGFLNFFLRDRYLLLDNDLNFKNEQLKDQVIVIETNNPNPFKAMHLGHALNAIIGDSLANLLEIGGARVHRVSYHGDIGSHVGKTMWAVLKHINNDPKNLISVEPNSRYKFLADMYSEGAKAYQADINIKAEIISLADQSYKLDDPIYKQVYQTCKDWSFEELDEVLKRLGSKTVERRYLESEVEPAGVEIVKKNIDKYFFLSKGALIFRGEDYGLFTTVFVSSSDRGLYAARDLGLIELKQRDFSPDKSMIVTASEQKDYFKVVIKASELCQIAKIGETNNITTGIVKLSSGKMSSRQGDAINIVWLFDEITAELSKYNKQVSQDLLVGAIRYQFLKVKLGSDIVFDIKQSISLQGNSGPYLMYAHARAQSIIRKSKQIIESVPDDFNIEDSERNLVLKIADFKDTMAKTISQLKPHLLCLYLYELSQEFNRFYEKNKVIGSDREIIRLYLVKSYAEVLRTGLLSLGIKALDEM